MWQRLVVVFFALVVAFGILITSIFRTAAVKYGFNSTVGSPLVTSSSGIVVDYQLPFPGRVLPDSRLWPVKALRDRVWLWTTTNPTRRAELKLLFADKRLASSRVLFEKGKPNIGLSTLTKGEKYLEDAINQEKENRKKGINTTEFLQRVALASLKHYELMQTMYTLAPDEARPVIVKSQTYAKRAFEEARNALLGKGLLPPENPFEW